MSFVSTLLLTVLVVGLVSSFADASVSPASDMEHHLNNMEGMLMEDPTVRDLEENELKNDNAYADGMEALQDGSAVWPGEEAPAPAMLDDDEHTSEAEGDETGASLAESGAEVNTQAAAGGSKKNGAKSKGANGLQAKIRALERQGMLSMVAVNAILAAA